VKTGDDCSEKTCSYWMITAMTSRVFVYSITFLIGCNLLPPEMRLERAVRKSDVESVEQILSGTSQLDLQWGSSELTIIDEAVLNGELEMVKLFDQYGFDMTLCVEDKFPLLTLATMEGHSEIVSFLLKKGADPNFVDKKGRTALTTAIQTNNEDVLSMLLSAGADPAITYHGFNALELALGRGLCEIAEEIEFITSFQIDDARYEELSIFCEASRAAEAVDEQLIRRTIDLKNDWGATPLMQAILADNTSFAKECLKAGADVLATDDSGITPLMIAASHSPGSLETVLEYTDQLDASDDDGDTALMWAIVMKNEAAARLLLDRGANPDIANDNGESPRSYAKQNGMDFLFSTEE